MRKESPACVGVDGQSTPIQVLGEAVIKHWHQLKSHSILSSSSNVAEHHSSKVSWVGEPKTQVPTFLSRSYRAYWATVRVTNTVPLSVSKTLGRPGEGGHCSRGLVFSCAQLQPTWFHLAAPGDRKDPEWAGASSPDNLSALIERQNGCTEPALISPAFVCVWFLSRLEVVTVTTSSMNHVSVKKQSFNCLT